MADRGTAAARTRRAVDAIKSELGTLDLDAPRAIDVVLPEIHALTELDALFVYQPRALDHGWELARWHAYPSRPRARELFSKALAVKHDALFYRPDRPPVAHRNRVCEATRWIDRAGPGTWESSWLCRQVFAPLHWQHHKQLRALLCDGASLLGWFGGIHASDVTAKQVRVLASLVPSMRRRLLVEQRLEAAPRGFAALEQALEHLGAAAFIIGGRGEIHETNSAGRAQLASHRAETAKALRDARHGKRSEFELTRLTATGMPAHWLAIHRTSSLEGRTRAAAARLQLTPRRSQVLHLLLQGQTNASIAATLDITERAVELHVSALLDAVGVNSRSALVAVLLR